MKLRTLGRILYQMLDDFGNGIIPALIFWYVLSLIGDVIDADNQQIVGDLLFLMIMLIIGLLVYKKRDDRAQALNQDHISQEIRPTEPPAVGPERSDVSANGAGSVAIGGNNAHPIYTRVENNTNRNEHD